MPFQVLNVPETRKLIKQIPVCRDIRWKENSEDIFEFFFLSASTAHSCVYPYVQESFH